MMSYDHLFKCEQSTHFNKSFSKILHFVNGEIITASVIVIKLKKQVGRRHGHLSHSNDLLTTLKRLIISLGDKNVKAHELR